VSDQSRYFSVNDRGLSVLDRICTSFVAMHRVNSRQRSTLVAFGAKRVLTEPRSERAPLNDYVGAE